MCILIHLEVFKNSQVSWDSDEDEETQMNRYLKQVGNLVVTLYMSSRIEELWSRFSFSPKNQR